MPIRSDGYVTLMIPDHPHADSNGYVYEHRVLVEGVIGHVLRQSAPIHHVDEDRGNNGRGNLVACDSNAYHCLLHKRKRAFDACGDPDALRCSICHSYARQEDMRSFFSDGRGPYGIHRECSRIQRRRRTIAARKSPAAQ